MYVWMDGWIFGSLKGRHFNIFHLGSLFVHTIVKCSICVLSSL